MPPNRKHLSSIVDDISIDRQNLSAIVYDMDALASRRPPNIHPCSAMIVGNSNSSSRRRRAKVGDHRHQQQQQPNGAAGGGWSPRMMIGTSIKRAERANNSRPPVKRAASTPSPFKFCKDTSSNTSAASLLEEYHKSYRRSFTVSGVREFNHLLDDSHRSHDDDDDDDCLTNDNDGDNNDNDDTCTRSSATRRSIIKNNKRKSAMKKKHNHEDKRELQRGVSFAHVEVREYNRTLGDHPGTGLLGDGPPLSIGWEYVVTSSQSIDQIEEERRGTQRELELVGRKPLPPLRLNHQQRRNILIWCGGFSQEEIEKATKEALKIRKQRIISQKENEAAHMELLKAAGKKLKSLAFLYVSSHPYT